MANSVLGILIKAQDQFSGQFGKLQTQIKGVQSGLTGLSTAMGTLGVGLSALAIARFGQESLRLAMDLEEAKGAFNNLATAAGANSASMLDSLRRASRGMTSELELIQSANRALLADSKVVIDNLDSIYRTAALGADALGISTTEAFDRMVKSISAMQTKGLKEFGINIDQSQAMDAFAASIGKVASELSIAEQETAFANAAIKEMEDLLARSGDAALSAADKFDIMNSSITNMKTAFGEMLASSNIVKLFEELTGVMVQTEVMFALLDEKGVGAIGTILKMAGVVDDLGAAFAAGQYDAQQYEAILRRIAGLSTGDFSIYSLTPPAARGGIQQPSTRMAGGQHPSQYGYGKNISQQEQVVTDYNERQAEAARRKSEYQSQYNEQLREELALIDSIRSRAESVLTAGTNVTAQDMLDTQAGTYQDKPLEAARRLADIAEKGMASPWAAILVPPPEVIAAGEAAVKAWAERTKQDVLDLTRPDLINWDAFIANYQDALNRESMREDTLDLAMQKLGEAGLLKGADRNQVAQLLGLETPQSAGELFASGFAEGVGGKDLSNLFLSAWQTDFDAQKAEYETAGKNLGGVIITGLNTAVKDNIPGVRQQIAYYIAPEVAKILAQADGSKP